MTTNQPQNQQPTPVWFGIFRVDPRTLNLPRPRAPRPTVPRVFNWPIPQQPTPTRTTGADGTTAVQ